MPPLPSRFPWHRALAWAFRFLAPFQVAAFAVTAHAELVTLKNGMELRGDFGETSSIAGESLAPTGSGSAIDAKLIHFIDDGLRRTFYSKYQEQDRRADIEQVEVIRIPQPVAISGRSVGILGSHVAPPSPFDAYGRRTYPLLTQRGRIEVVQGITEVTPLYTRVEGLQVSEPYIWDMRLATSSFPSELLLTILRSVLDKGNADDRLRIVRLFLQMERYGEAEEELRHAMQDFKELAELEDNLRTLQRLRARQLLDEIRLRKKAGQDRLASTMVEQFPLEGVPGETLAELQELAEGFQQERTQLGECRLLITKLKKHAAADPAKRELEEVLDEILTHLGPATLARISDFLRLEKAASNDDERLALAVSSWLISGAARDDLPFVQSVVRVKNMTVAYLRSSPEDRARILAALTSEEAGSPKTVSRLLASLVPPRDPTHARTPAIAPAAVKTPGSKEGGEAATESGDRRTGGADDEAASRPEESVEATADSEIPGLWHMRIDGIREGQFIEYSLQLPPEYSPYRRYPTLVTLPSMPVPPRVQIDWWAGGYSKDQGMRLGQATRHGYIVLSPHWTRPKSQAYEYSLDEHAAILGSLRDALQRFSIDTDRIFLSGHSQGGDAAWDIGLSHPDLWAGVLPFVALASHGNKESPRYVTHYHKNARHAAWYFVTGEKDSKRTELNATDFHRYFRQVGLDFMLTEYLGRGHEALPDEILRAFRWMNLQRRRPTPAEFEVVSRRPWDNFFWCLEMHGLLEKAMVAPSAWPPPGSSRPMPVAVAIREKRNVTVSARAAENHVWLSPEEVDFDTDVTVTINGRKIARRVQPSTEVLLEDARSRGDRQRPFWAKVSTR